MTGHPSKTRYLLLIFLALILAACRSRAKITLTPAQDPGASSLLSASMQTLEPAATPTPVTLENGWYVYNDPDGEFSFAYPPDAIISAGQNPVDLSKNITIQFRIPETTYQGMSFRIEPNPKKLQGEEIARQLYEKSAQKPASAAFTSSVQQFQVGGLSAVKTHIPASNTEVTVIVPYAVKVLITSPVHDASAIKVDQQALDLFYQVLNTLKFNTNQ